MCDHHLLGDPTGLPCTRQEPHDRGHIYTASAGPDLDNSAPTTPKRHAGGDDQ